MTTHPARRITRHLLAAMTATGLTLFILVGLLLVVELTIPLPMQAESSRWLAAKVLNWPTDKVAASGQLTLITGPHAGLQIRDLQVTVAEENAARSFRMDSGEFRLATAALLYGELELSLAASGMQLCQPPRPDSTDDESEEKEEAEKDGAEKTSAARLANLHLAKVRIENAAMRISRHCDTPESSLNGSADVSGSIYQLSILAQGENSFHLEGSGYIGQLPWKIDTTQSWPLTSLQLKGQLGATDLTLHGTLQQNPLLVDADVTVTSPQFYELARFSPFPLKDFGPLSAAARIHVANDEIRWNLQDVSFNGGSWQGSGRLQKSGAGIWIESELSTPVFSEPALRAWLQQSLDPPRMKPGKLTKDLLGALQNTRGKLHISTPSIESALPLPMENAVLRAQWQDAALRLDFSQQLAGESFTVEGSGSFTQDEFHLLVSAHTQTLTTASLSTLQQPTGLSGTFGRLSGTTSIVIPMATGLVKSVKATLDAPELLVTLENDGLPAPLVLSTFAASIGNAAPLTLAVKGSMGSKPIATDISITQWSDLLQQQASPFDLQVALGKTGLTLEGKAALNNQSPTLAAQFSMHLPKAGDKQPDIDLSGQINYQAKEWQLELDTIRAGRSEGKGKVRINAAETMAEMDADLQISVLQLADFGVTLGTPQAPANKPLPPLPPSPAVAEEWLRPVRALFNELDGHLKVVIERWQLDDMEGPARLKASLKDSRLDIVLTDLKSSVLNGNSLNDSALKSGKNIKEGAATGTLALDLSHPKEIAMSLGLRVTDGYYQLSRDSASQVSGKLNLDLSLSTHGIPGSGAMLQALNGNLRFMAIPDRGEFLLLDIWLLRLQ
jgi:hypothetical protein